MPCTKHVPNTGLNGTSINLLNLVNYAIILLLSELQMNDKFKLEGARFAT